MDGPAAVQLAKAPGAGPAGPPRADAAAPGCPPSDAPPRSARPAKCTLFQRFAQQELAGWAPIITPGAVVLYFALAGVACAALGAPVLAASLSVAEARARYDDAGPMAGLTGEGRAKVLAVAGGAGVPVSVDVPIERAMTPPIYVYYELRSYFQNHKRYVRSRDDQQMGGVPGPPAERCAPQQFTADGAPVSPCGLVAWSFFNDTFAASLVDAEGGEAPLAMDSSNIAWQYDAKHLYADAPPQNFNDDPATRGGNTSAVGIASNQHLMVWLRPAASPSFRKLYGVLGTALPAGSTVRIAVLNRYNTYGFNGHKAVVLSTDSWAGGRNHFLGAAFLATAALCLLTAAAFGAAAAGGCGPAARRRKFGDPAELSWNRRPA